MEESRRAASTFLELFEYVFDLGVALEESLVGVPHYFVLFLLGKNLIESAFNRFRLGTSAQCFLHSLQFAAVESYMFMDFYTGAFHGQPLVTSLSQDVHKITIYVHHFDSVAAFDASPSACITASCSAGRTFAIFIFSRVGFTRFVSSTTKSCRSGSM